MKKYLPWFLATTMMVVLDLLFKFHVLRNESSFSTLPEGEFVGLGLHKNPGIAFNIPIPQPLLWVLTVILIGTLLWVAWQSRNKQPLMTLGALITTVGALGNFIDRVVNAFTTDYLLFFTGTAINLSDLVIIGGVVVLLMAQRPSLPPSEH